MSRQSRRIGEWMLRRVEGLAVFGAMTWALIWIRTKREEVTMPLRRPRLPDTADGHIYETIRTASWPAREDPDGGAAWDYARRRRLVD
jgi:hypothetical protein